jgi:ATP-dependent DNA helicase MPH1
MSEGREDLNWDKAQDSHREIQEEILHSRNLELFEDVERLLPPGHFPKVEEMQMEVDPWDPENLQEKLAASKAYQKAGAPGKKGEGSISLTKMVNEEKEKGKRKTKGKGTATGPGTHRGAEIPEDAPIGFKSVAELLREAEDRRAMRRREAAKAQAGYSSDLDFDDLGEVAEYEQEREVRDDGMRRESERRARSPVKRKRKRGASPVRSESEDYEDDIGDGDPFAEFDARNTAKGDKQLEKSPAPKSSKVKNVKAAKPKAKVERPAKAASKSTAKTAQHRGTSGRTVGVPNRDGSFSGDDDIEVLDATDDVKADHGASRGGVENNQEPALQLSAAAYAPASSPFRIGTMNFDDFDDIDIAQFDDTRPSSPALRSPAPAARTKAVLDPPAKRTVAKTKQVRESEAASVPSSGQALDFFNTSGPIRRGGPSRLVHPPSPPDSPSPSPSPAPSPVKSAKSSPCRPVRTRTSRSSSSASELKRLPAINTARVPTAIAGCPRGRRKWLDSARLRLWI